MEKRRYTTLRPTEYPLPQKKNNVKICIMQFCCTCYSEFCNRKEVEHSFSSSSNIINNLNQDQMKNYFNDSVRSLTAEEMKQIDGGKKWKTH